MNIFVFRMLVLLCMVLPATGTEITLKNGTVYKGTIVAETADFYSLQVGKSRITINKQLVAKKDGKSYSAVAKGDNTSLPGDAGGKQTVKTVAAPVEQQRSATVVTKESIWNVTLKNGQIFRGKKISDNSRLLVIESGGNQVSVFRNMITAIDSGVIRHSGNDMVEGGSGRSQSKAASPIVMYSSQQPAIVPAGRSRLTVSTLSGAEITSGVGAASDSTGVASAPLAGKKSPASFQPTEKLTTTQDVPPGEISVIPSPRRLNITSIAADTPNAESKDGVSSMKKKETPATKTTAVSSISRNGKDTAAMSDTGSIRVITAPPFAFVMERKKSAEGSPPKENPTTSTTKKAEVEAVAPLVLPVQPPRASRSVDSLQGAAVPKAQQTPVEPEKRKVAPAPPSQIRVKRTDGKQVITLTNGTSFTGVVTTEGGRSIAFNADGAVITILKSLIKDIDGTPYAMEQPPAPVFKPGTSTVKTSSGITPVRSEQIKNSLFRILPVTELPQGLTVGMCIDSIKSRSDWRSRSRAVRFIGAMGPWGTSAIPVVLEMLSDSSGIQLLVPVVIDSENVSMLLPPGLEAARVLAQLGNQGVVELVKASKKESPLLRRHAQFGLGNCFFEQASQAVTAALKDSDPQVRRAALGSLRSQSAMPALTAALSDPDPIVKSAAVYLIARLGDKRSLPFITKMTKDKKSLIRAAVADALGALGSETETRLLVTFVQDNDAAVRTAAIRSLGTLKDSTALDMVIAATTDSSAEVRIAAVESLGKFRNSRSIPTLYAMLKDESGEVREKAQLSVRMHTEIPLLIAALDDESFVVRSNVSYILWLLSGQDFGDDKKAWSGWAATQGGSIDGSSPSVPVKKRQ